jgi:flagellar protein FliL
VKLLKGKIVLLALGLAVGAGGVFGAAAALGDGLPFGKPAAAAAVRKVAPVRKAADEQEAGIMYPLKERIVNLADPGVSRYLKTTVVLEMADTSGKPLPRGEEYKKKQDELVKGMKAHAPIVEDKVTTMLSAKTAAELMTLEGKQRLKEELKAGLNRALAGNEEVLAVYFSDFIIQ